MLDSMALSRLCGKKSGVCVLVGFESSSQSVWHMQIENNSRPRYSVQILSLA